MGTSNQYYPSPANMTAATLIVLIPAAPAFTGSVVFEVVVNGSTVVAGSAQTFTSAGTGLTTFACPLPVGTPYDIRVTATGQVSALNVSASLLFS
jgi:hypothetical protein